MAFHQNETAKEFFLSPFYFTETVLSYLVIVSIRRLS